MCRRRSDGDISQPAMTAFKLTPRPIPPPPAPPSTAEMEAERVIPGVLNELEAKDDCSGCVDSMAPDSIEAGWDENREGCVDSMAPDSIEAGWDENREGCWSGTADIPPNDASCGPAFCLRINPMAIRNSDRLMRPSQSWSTMLHISDNFWVDSPEDWNNTLACSPVM